MVLAPGSHAPAVPGIDPTAGPMALFFFKVTCPVCQMSAPKAEAFARTYPGRIVGVGEDPAPKLAEFGERYGMSLPTVPDVAPYDLSEAYELEVVPTLFVVDEQGMIVDAVESWDRDRYNRASERLAELTGLPFVPISVPGDGLPPFRPG